MCSDDGKTEWGNMSEWYIQKYREEKEDKKLYHFYCTIV